MVALPTDPLYSAKLRISRADELLDQLVADIDRFFDQKPFRYVAEPEPDGKHVIHKITLVERFPVSWRIYATEIVEHLRSALDHATFAAFYLATGRTNSNYAAFAFGKKQPDLDNSIKGRSKDLPVEIQALLRTFKAYEGGNDLLYTLNELANNCKHGLIAFIGGAVVGGEFRSNAVTGPFQLYDPIWDAETNEIKYARVPVEMEFVHQGKLQVCPFIPNTEHLAGIGATGVLDAIGSEVAHVVDAIEDECRRIGILT